MKRLLRCSGIAIALLVLVIIVAVIFAPDSEPSPTLKAEPTTQAAEPPTQEPVAVSYPLERGGSVDVPGGTAYMDGRDAEADPPLTVMNINLWENPEPNRGKALCKVAHGTAVTLMDTTGSGDMREFKIKAPACTGWVWQLFLSDQRNAPVGDQIN